MGETVSSPASGSGTRGSTAAPFAPAASGASPALSVVMPVYNAAGHLRQAIDSVLGQTFSDFELLLLDDGSSDDGAAILASYQIDPRVRLLPSSSNQGLIATLHRGFAAARAPLLARMDADDVCAPERFARQVEFLRTHPEVDIVGCAIRFFGNTVEPRVFTFPCEHEQIRVAMLFYCPLAHPALMLRRGLVDEGLMVFDEAFRHAEDLHLWSRLLLRKRAANLPQCLLDYRLHGGQVSSGQASAQYEASLRVRKLLLTEAGASPSSQDLELHESVILERVLPDARYLERLSAWFDNLLACNERSGYWQQQALAELLQAKFQEVERRVAASRRDAGVRRSLRMGLETFPVGRRLKQCLRALRGRLRRRGDA